MTKELSLTEMENLQGGGFECLKAFLQSSALFGAAGVANQAYQNGEGDEYGYLAAALFAAFLISIPGVDAACL